jgi:hypothetical protein
MSPTHRPPRLPAMPMMGHRVVSTDVAGILTMLFLAAAVAAFTLLGTPVKAEEAADPIETCNGRVTAFVGTGESIKKGVRMLHVRDGEDCNFFVTERVSANGKRILRTCPIGSSCRIEARLFGGDGGIDTIISVTRIKANAQEMKSSPPPLIQQGPIATLPPIYLARWCSSDNNLFGQRENFFEKDGPCKPENILTFDGAGLFTQGHRCIFTSLWLSGTSWPRWTKPQKGDWVPEVWAEATCDGQTLKLRINWLKGDGLMLVNRKFGEEG